MKTQSTDRQESHQSQKKDDMNLPEDGSVASPNISDTKG